MAGALLLGRFCAPGRMAVRAGWALTPAAFDRLLRELDRDRDAAGQHYENLRRRLTRFFDIRGSVFSEEHADETLNRLARKLEAGEEIRDVPTYAVGVARMVLKEVARAEQARAPLHNEPYAMTGAESSADADCMVGCLDALSPSDRELILEYYQGEKRAKIERRQQLSRRMGVPVNGLRLRAYRIRRQLEACVTACLGSPVGKAS